MFERLFASRLDRHVAEEEATFALHRHGPNAITYLQEQLEDPRHRERRSLIRLAMREVKRRQRGPAWTGENIER